MRGFDVELDQLLHPASIFDHPRDVLNDPDLTIQEKRAILSSWASELARSRRCRRCVSRPEPNDPLPSMRSWTRCAASTTIQIGHVLEGSRCGSRDGAGGETTKVQAVPR